MATSAPPGQPGGPGLKPKVLILTGPTAVGKTKASLALAERLNGEIISADSVQVYRGLDVGSDKIPMAERRGIPHHLLDILEPPQDFSAGDFYRLARQAAAEVLQRGRTPIVVGGTGFYLRWFIFGRPATPAASPQSEANARERLEQAYAAARAAAGGRELSEAEKWEAGVAVVEALGDPESATRLRGELNNYYRLLRVVDILLQRPGKTLAELDLDESRPLDYDFRCFFLHRPRAQLYSRIDQRVEQMVQGGLLQEAQMLLDAGMAPNSNCATRAIGYRQALDFLAACHAEAAQRAQHAEREAAQGQRTGPEQQQRQVTEQHAQAGNTAQAQQAGQEAAAGALTEDRVIQLVRDIQTASRKLCHRQMVWFRDDPMFKWVDATAGDDQVIAEILDCWGQPAHQGGCGTSGRLTKEEERAMRQYQAKLDLYAKPGLPAVRQTLQEARDLVLARAGSVQQAQHAEQGAAIGGQRSGKEAQTAGRGGECDDVAGEADGQLQLVQERQQPQERQQDMDSGSDIGHAAQQLGTGQAGLTSKQELHELKRQRQV